LILNRKIGAAEKALMSIEGIILDREF